ncbi:hypothetical protein X975_19232, partial [Stegodyphus mimosarum]
MIRRVHTAFSNVGDWSSTISQSLRYSMQPSVETVSKIQEYVSKYTAMQRYRTGFLQNCYGFLHVERLQSVSQKSF